MDKVLEVAIISGNSKPGECGVEDYTSLLVNELSKTNINIVHIKVSGILSWIKLFTMISGKSIVHFQYPVVAWRKSFYPLIFIFFYKILFGGKIVLTLHEFDRSHILRKFLCLILLSFADYWVTTSYFEAGIINRLNFWRKKINVIPIGSNINYKPKSRVDKGEVVYFGLLAPNKGLEIFLSISDSLLISDYRFAVIGQVASGCDDWLSKLKLSNPKIDFYLNLPSDEVSELLSSFNIALLPYPDGVSERRGTALAALAHGLNVVCTEGRATLDVHRQIFNFFESKEDAVALIKKLLSNGYIVKDKSIYKKYLEDHSWNNISSRHLNLYINI